MDNTAALRADPNRSTSILDRSPAGRWGTPDDLASFFGRLRTRQRQIHGRKSIREFIIRYGEWAVFTELEQQRDVVVHPKTGLTLSTAEGIVLLVPVKSSASCRAGLVFQLAPRELCQPRIPHRTHRSQTCVVLY
jgi:hypothetical protein